MSKITALPLIDPGTIDGTETIPSVKDGATGRSSLAALAQPFLEAVGLLRDQAADLVDPANIFIDVALAFAEAATADGDVFKIVDSAEGTASVYLRTAGGSTELYQEVTKAALGAPDGGKHIGVGPGASVIDALGLVVRGTGAAAVDTLRLQAAAAAVADGGRIRIVGPELVLNAQVEIAGKENVTLLFDPGVTVTLAAVDWTGVPAAIVFRDCIQPSLLGLPTIDCNGQETISVACISTDATGWSNVKIAKDFVCEARFVNCDAQPGLLCRLVDGVVLNRPGLRGKAVDEYGIVISRCDRVRVLHPDVDGEQAGAPSNVNGSGVVISPGQVSGEFDRWPAITFAEPSHFFGQIKRTAPVGTDTWEVSVEPDFATYALIAATTLTSEVNWYFHCAEWAASGEIFSRQITVTATDDTPGARTLTLQLKEADGSTARNWNGEVLYIYGIRHDRLCRDVQVIGGSIRNCSGCGVFLLGCDQWLVDGLHTEKNSDLGYDAEWCRRGGFIGCNDTTPNGAGNASGGLLYCLDKTFALECSGINRFMVLGGGEIAQDMHLIGLKNMRISVGTISTGPLLIDSLVIERHAQDAASAVLVGIFGAGSHADAKGKNLIKHVRIRNSSWRVATQDCIRWSHVYDIVIEDNDVLGAFRLAQIDAGGAGGAGENKSSGIVIRRNRLRSYGRTWIGIPLLTYNGTIGLAPSAIFEDNEIIDEIAGTRQLYAIPAGTGIPAYRRGEGKLNWNGGGVEIAAGAVGAWSADIALPGARIGDSFEAWPYAQGDFAAEGEVYASGLARIRLRNRSSAPATPVAADYGYQVRFR